MSNNKDVKAPRVRIKRARSLRTRRAITGYIFILPFIIGFVAFMVSPLYESLRMSFSEVRNATGQRGFSFTYVGIFNYNRALKVDPEFTRMLTDELVRMVTNVPAILVFSLFVALLLNQKFKGRGFVRAIFFLPVILSSGVLVGLEYNNALLQGMGDVIKEASAANITTAIEDMLENSGLGRTMMQTVLNLINGIYNIAIASGIQIIVFLSGLQTIPQSMYEAAKIEGCTSWESFWKITFPMVSSILLVNVVYSIVDCFLKSNNEVMSKISTAIISNLDYGFGSAMSWLYFVAVILIIGVFTGIISRGVYYYE